MKRITTAILSVALLMCCAGCSRIDLASSSTSASSTSSIPAPESSSVTDNVALPLLLSELGYCIDIPTDIGIVDPNKAIEEKNIYPMLAKYFCIESDSPPRPQVYGSECLFGDFTVLQPVCSYGLNNGDSQLAFSLLQAFSKEDVELPNAGFRFISPKDRQTVDSKSELKFETIQEYIVYSDNEIVVYDLFALTGAPSLEQQLEALWQEQGYNAFGLSYNWILDMQDYFLVQDGGIGRFVNRLTSDSWNKITNLEEQPYNDVSLTFFGLLSPVNGLSTAVTIVNNRSDVVAGIATCQEGTLNDSGKKSNVYFSKDKSGEVNYTVPNTLVDDRIVFNFYDANSKLVLTKSLMVIAGEDGFTLYEERGL